MYTYFLLITLLASCAGKSPTQLNNTHINSQTIESNDSIGDEIILDASCTALWFDEFNPKEEIDTTVELSYNNLMNLKLTLDSFSFADSLHDFVTHIDSLLQAENSFKMGYYYLHRVKLLCDGATAEFLSDFYYQLFFGNPCEFYQVMAIERKFFDKEWEDLSLELSLIKDDCIYNRNDHPDYIANLKSRHLALFENNTFIKKVVDEVFEFILAP